MAAGEDVMKITVNVDCTPEEARAFFGLPDLKPVQDAVLQELQNRMMAALASMEPDALMKSWLPMQMQNMEQLQKMFWSHFTAGGPKETSE
jgi:hypothetical protein